MEFDVPEAFATYSNSGFTLTAGKFFTYEGIEIVTKATISDVEGKSGDRVKIHAVRDGEKVQLEGTHILVASGRTPNTQNIGLELAGVETTGNGHVKVNERLQTTAPGIWAVGDCAGSPHFTHIAFDDYRVVTDNLAGGQSNSFSLRNGDWSASAAISARMPRRSSCRKSLMARRNPECAIQCAE